MKRLVIVLMLMSTGVFAAAGPQQHHTETHSGAMPAMPMTMANCPMKLPGVDVAVLDTPAGVALTFTAKPENVTELRRRAEHMAAMHTGEHPHEAMMPGHMMPGNVKYEAVEKGARLTLTPEDPASRAEFRTQVRTHVERMKTGDCSMMHGMMGGAEKPAELKPEPKNDDSGHGAHQPAGTP